MCIIWGLYLNFIIVPVFFLIFGVVIICKELRIKKVEKYSKYIFLILVFAMISNMKISNLENKFANLYGGIDKADIVRHNY